MQNLTYALLTVPMVLIIAIAIFGNFSSNIDQTDWSTDANDTFDKVNTGTWNGFNLASMLPFVIIAVVIVGIILGAFVLKGAM